MVIPGYYGINQIGASALIQIGALIGMRGAHWYWKVVTIMI